MASLEIRLPQLRCAHRSDVARHIDDLREGDERDYIASGRHEDLDIGEDNLLDHGRLGPKGK